MRMVDLIEKKVRGEELTHEELAFIVNGFVNGSIPDYQMSAFQMAVVFQGMTDKETGDLTLTMMHSGDVVDLSGLRGIKVDKHSTGGVGDTTTLITAPLVAACGGTVAKMSGRGLGHTGGTLDKLESVPGVCVEQSLDRFKEIVNDIGIAVIGQSADLDPADKKIYALRDVTGTVKSVPLIASSIMSKKLAAGAEAIVLDVKTGSGAFMETTEEAEKLARLMVSIGKYLNRNCVAVITDMNQPLGLSVGNALEVKDAVEVLSGNVPEDDPLYQVSMILAEQMLCLAHIAENEEQAGTMLKKALESGAGLRKLQQMFRALGGDDSYVCHERIDELCKVDCVVPVTAEKDGYLSEINTILVGKTAQILGAGRAAKDDVIDPAVGLVMKKRIGDYVKKGEELCELRLNNRSVLEDALNLFRSAVTLSEEKPAPKPLVYSVIK